MIQLKLDVFQARNRPIQKGWYLCTIKHNLNGNYNFTSLWFNGADFEDYDSELMTDKNVDVISWSPLPPVSALKDIEQSFQVKTLKDFVC